MLKRKIVLPNQDQRCTNSVPTPYLLRKIEICTFADGGEDDAAPRTPLGGSGYESDASTLSQIFNTYFTLWHVPKLAAHSVCSAVRLVQ